MTSPSFNVWRENCCQVSGSRKGGQNLRSCGWLDLKLVQLCASPYHRGCVCTTNSALLCILVPACTFCTISAVSPKRQLSVLCSTATVPLPVLYHRTTALHFNLSADLLFRQATCLWAQISFPFVRCCLPRWRLRNPIRFLVYQLLVSTFWLDSTNFKVLIS